MATSYSQSHYVYVIFSLKEWEETLRNMPRRDVISIEPEWSWSLEPFFHDFITGSISKKTGLPKEQVHPITTYYTKPPTWIYPRRRVVCKVRIDDPSKQLVWYDDQMYVWLLNTLGNGHYEFMSTSEEESKRMFGASRDENIKSYDRMFDIDLIREHKWIGAPIPCAFIGRLTRDMIVKCQVYNGSKKER